LEAVRELDQKDVVRMETEEVVEAASEIERPVPERARPALGPDDVKGGARDVFPAQDEVRAELAEIEIRVGEGVISVTVNSIPKFR
jgi:hypothetical protein